MTNIPAITQIEDAQFVTIAGTEMVMFAAGGRAHNCPREWFEAFWRPAKTPDEILSGFSPEDRAIFATAFDEPEPESNFEVDIDDDDRPHDLRPPVDPPIQVTAKQEEPALRSKILDALKEEGPMDAFELATFIYGAEDSPAGEPGQTLRAMVKEGEIVKIAKRGTGKYELVRELAI